MPEPECANIPDDSSRLDKPQAADGDCSERSDINIIWSSTPRAFRFEVTVLAASWAVADFDNLIGLMAGFKRHLVQFGIEHEVAIKKKVPNDEYVEIVKGFEKLFTAFGRSWWI